MTTAELAAASAIPESQLDADEHGAEEPACEALTRILNAAKMRPSIPLVLFADEILREAARWNLQHVRVFGSTVRGQDTDTSDIDLLVALTPATSLFDLGGFAQAVESLTGFTVDILTDDLAGDEHFRHVLDEAVPL
ncbi:nucleotidyltransferase family protein [Curtobacterium pusillum]|uniref:nucleotidyltransferase family protein n=1 Tax=Curtobacterium pusillum TaxID=69373 RepID=UPI0021B69F51|nr:nucleotidyltransferase domain-containing protein [Curtobacterium pusillum]